MNVNADFTLPVVVTRDLYRWVPSPQHGVERVMLDRVGGEVARATSIVRYAPQSTFPRHLHPGGEEILVLSGTFSDETGDYPAGWYLRNPPGSAHQPSSIEGALIFVKLYQMRPAEATEVRINTQDPVHWTPGRSGYVCTLFSDSFESVSMQRIQSAQSLAAVDACSLEFLVLQGELRDGNARYASGAWLRFPHGKRPALKAGADGATVYVKATQTPEQAA